MMDNTNRPHKLLNNPQATSNHFDASRGFENEEEEAEESEKDYERQKSQLSADKDRMDSAVQLKYQRRTLDVPADIDYLRIDFLDTFDNNNDYKTRDRFERDFGLRAVRFYNFNKSALFEIEDPKKFETFYGLLYDYIGSARSVDPKGTPYSILTFLSGFRFLSREEMLQAGSLQPGANSLTLELTRTIDSSQKQDRQRIYQAMVRYLSEKPQLEIQLQEGDYLAIKGISDDLLDELLDNFDVIASVQAIRVPAVRQLGGGQSMRLFDFHIRPLPGQLPLVGVIDNGIKPIPPLADSISATGHTFDLIHHPYRPIGWHGTAVGVIATAGEAFFSGANLLDGHCQLVSYRVFENDNGQIDLIQFERNIRSMYGNGTRFFNLSINVGFKAYNSDYSYFSYLLDKLAYELDILFFISAGNLDGDDLHNIYQTIESGTHHDLLNYPKHFFFPEASCDEHTCDGTNLKVPAESLNNLSVGAIAENMEPGSMCDMTLDKALPAYYTSKYHISPFHKVNGTRLKSKHINYRITKPDIVFPGGDYGAESAGMQLVGTGMGTDQFRSDCGTSFSTPMAANLAARLAIKYPSLNTQSIKALIINSAEKPTDSSFLQEHLAHLKALFSITEFGKNYGSLNRSEKLKVDKWFNEKDLLFRLVGHGVPQRDRSLDSDNKSITVIIQDNISVGTHKAIPIHLPDYLNKFSKHKTPIVTVEATLCFKFQPNFKDQTGYNPLHMSFNFIRTFSDAAQTADIAAHRDGTEFYRNLYRGIEDPKLRSAKRSEELGVKRTVGTWSDDFYPNGRQFSNSQKLQMPINVNDLNKSGNSLSLIIRCTGKNSVDFDTQSYLLGSHPYSMVLTFTERKNKELASYDFYEEFSRLNQTLDIIAQTDLDTDLEAEA